MEIFNGVKKFVFALSLGAGLLFGVSALAAALAPGPMSTPSTMPSSWSATPAMAGQQAGSAKVALPCVMMKSQQSSGMGITRAMPCGNLMYRSMLSPAYVMGGQMGTWFALLFVITLIMVWIILLLLIGILWHMLKKHRRS